MNWHDLKYIGISKEYKNIRTYKSKLTQELFYEYRKQIDGVLFRSSPFSDAKECAKMLDLALIKNGHQPINVLKKV